MSEFDAILAGLGTGDVLLYRTRDLGAWFNSIATSSFWSHVGLVVKGDDPAMMQALFPKDYKELPLDQCGLCVFEAVPNRGVCLFPLKERLARTANSIHTLAVRHHVGTEPSPEQITALTDFVKQVLGRKLEVGSCDMIKAVLPCVYNHSENWDRFFCSELVAEGLQQAGILREHGLNSNDVLPRNFASGGVGADLLSSQCLEGHSFGPEHYMVQPTGALRNELKLLKKESKERFAEARRRDSSGGSGGSRKMKDALVVQPTDGKPGGADDLV